MGQSKFSLLATAVVNHIDANHANNANFVGATARIATVKAACAALVGNAAYDKDASWQPICADLQAFGARF